MVLFYIVSFLLLDLTPSTCMPIHMPTSMEMVDMTYTFDETTLNKPTVKKFQKKVIHNGTTDGGYWLLLEEYTSSTHAGTHMDAPSHVSPEKWNIDEIPLDRLVAPAAVVDIRDKAVADSDALVEEEDLRQWEQISGRSLNNTIVVIRSGWGRRWNDTAAYLGNADNDTDNLHFPGISPNASQWLVDNRDIYGVATDALSVDYGKSKDFMTHRILYNANVYGLENVANVEEIPIVGATLHVMPMKIGKGSGAPVRIIATYPKVIF